MAVPPVFCNASVESTRQFRIYDCGLMIPMSDRFFVETPIDSEQAELIGPEAHHLAHVMRAGPGAEVTLFDGSGAEFAARVTKIGRSRVELTVSARREIDRELPFPLVLGVALPKGDRQKWLVEKATELG